MATKPQVTKRDPSVGTNMEEIFDSTFKVPEQVAAEIKEAGLVSRWINATEFKKAFGFHKNRWQPFQSKYMKSLANGIFGGDPEGYVRRGDLILAVKSKELQDKHRAFVKDRTEALAGKAKQHKAKLREIAREHGVKTNIDDDYDDLDEQD